MIDGNTGGGGGGGNAVGGTEWQTTVWTIPELNLTGSGTSLTNNG